MNIRFFLFLCIFILLFIGSFFAYKHINYKKYIIKSNPIQDYIITETNCNPSIGRSSSINVIYKNKMYRVLSTNDFCKKIQKNLKKPTLYYIANNDSIFMGGIRIFYALMVITFFFLIFPIFGFYVYRNELDNSYKTM